MKTYKKLGFTLGEMILAILIIGICIAMALSSMKAPQDTTTKYAYTNAYTSLEKAFYNAMQSGMNPFLENEKDVHNENEDDGTLLICQGLTTFINFKNVQKGSNYSNDCSSTKITSQLANDFREENIQFTATNGMDFYLSNRITDPNNKNFKFYLAFIDINGNQTGPNSVTYTFPNQNIEDRFRQNPDIFAFALIHTGRVVPIGIPEFDRNILSTKIVSFDENGKATPSPEKYSLADARARAWGYYKIPEDENMVRLNDTYYNIDDPLTMGGYIRSLINDDSKIKLDLPNEDFLTQTTPDINNDTHCQYNNMESCYIVVDLYKW